MFRVTHLLRISLDWNKDVSARKVQREAKLSSCLSSALEFHTQQKARDFPLIDWRLPGSPTRLIQRIFTSWHKPQKAKEPSEEPGTGPRIDPGLHCLGDHVG